MKTITITDRAEITAIIRKCPYCMVGLVDEQGDPYVVPMNFAYVDNQGPYGTLYLHSGPDGGKVSMAERHPEVCVTFCEGHELVYMHQQIACSYSMKSRSVVCRGNVRFIEDLEEKRHALECLMRQYTDNACRMAEPAVRNVRIWEIRIERLTCKAFGLRPSEL